MSLKDVEAHLESTLLAMPGWCTVEKGKRVAALAYGATLCVELGVFGGRSLLAMALALEDQKYGRADGIDPFTVQAALEGVNDPANDEWWSQLPYEEIAQRAEATFTHLSALGFVRLVRKRSADAVDDYVDRSVDLLHQDSNHSERVSCEEVELWAPKMRPGGTWIFDDTNWPTTQAAQQMLIDRLFTEQEGHYTWKVFRAPW
jgi:predicted O-methyltransferase YrrM